MFGWDEERDRLDTLAFVQRYDYLLRRSPTFLQFVLDKLDQDGLPIEESFRLADEFIVERAIFDGEPYLTFVNSL